MRVRGTTVFVVAVAASLSLSCKHGESAGEAKNAGGPPPGEAWLSDGEVNDAKLESVLVDEQDVDDTVVTGGKLAFDDLRVSHVFSPVTGKVAKIDASLGQRVKKGDPLAVIESPDVGIASSDLGKAKADLDAAEHDYKREKALWESHATSAKDLETAEDTFRRARAELERARQKTLLFRAGSVDAVTQSFTLRAGIDGEVIARNVNPNVEIQGQYGGNTVNELFTIGELDKVWLIADVYEMDFGRVKVGTTMTAKVIAYPKRPISCVVDYLSGTLDPVTRTAKARCTVDNPDRTLKPEMYATVSIAVEHRRALAIPRGALFPMGDATVVFLDLGKQPDGRRRFQRIPVLVDDPGDNGPWLQVRRGVNKGQRVVTTGGDVLTKST